MILRRSDGADDAIRLQLFEQREMIAPVDQVVHLVEVDVIAKEFQRGARLPPSFVRRRRPDLLRDERSRSRLPSAMPGTRSASAYMGDESKR